MTQKKFVVLNKVTMVVELAHGIVELHRQRHRIAFVIDCS